LKNQALAKLSSIIKKVCSQLHKKNLQSIQPLRLINKTKAAIALIMLVCLLGTLVFLASSSFSISTIISTTGVVRAIGVGVYWDAGMTDKVTTIDWGVLDPGTQKTVTVYIQNEGNSAITLTQSTLDWNPSSASAYVTLTWDYNGQAISAGDSLRVTLTLTISSSIIGVYNFNFNIEITGTG
jgi:hypothetical protein